MSIHVTTHTGRSLLHAAALFKEDKDVVWEYVVNSLQYVDPGVRPIIQVTVKPRKGVITISDNGEGMDEDGLRHFFTVHGENRERLQGRGGRGKFGTGKSAAFGIAGLLRVDSRRDGIRNVLELTKADISKSSGEAVPVRQVKSNETTDLRNGTVITIGEITVKQLQVQRIVGYVERHLVAFRASQPKVAVNDHVCVVFEPDVDGPPRIFHPPGTLRDELGDVELSISVSRRPLEEAARGVLITAGQGNTIAIEDGGLGRKDFGDYLFGEMDVPVLDEQAAGVDAYHSDRSLSLNPNHPLAQKVSVFIATQLERVRKELLARQREASKTEQARRLNREANRIADMLNKDFSELQKRLRDIRAAAGTEGRSQGSFGSTGEGGEDSDTWISGEQEIGDLVDPEIPDTGPPQPHPPRPAPQIPEAGFPNPGGDASVDPSGGEGKPRKRPRGGFKVDFDKMGRDGRRAEFRPEALEILINLEHPVVAVALGDGDVEDISFRRLSYEIAFSEYSMAIGYQMLMEDQDIPGDDLLYEVRDTLNRVSRLSAELYA